MGAITGFAPIIAPMIGGVLQTVVGWRSIFVLLLAFAVASGAMAAWLLPETLRERTPGRFSPAAMGALYRSVLVHRGFLANLGILTTSFIGLFAWVSGAPIVMQGVRYGLSPLVFGVTFALGALGYTAGTFIASRIVMRFGLDRTMGIGCVALALGGLAMVAVEALDLGSVFWFVGAMMIYLAGLGFALPMSMAGALTPFPDRAGTASSLLGFAQQSGAAIAAAAIGLYLGTSAWPVAATVVAMGFAALAIWAFTRRVRTGKL
jgi:DHA1 family bicyclomycin/chloramphenicol resistance-like MFS transporter